MLHPGLKKNTTELEGPQLVGVHKVISNIFPDKRSQVANRWVRILTNGVGHLAEQASHLGGWLHAVSSWKFGVPTDKRNLLFCPEFWIYELKYMQQRSTHSS